MSNDGRENEILKLLTSQRRAVVTVKQICRQCYISESSARRDLRKLEKAGLIKRVHGGAKIISVEDIYKDDPAADNGSGSRIAEEVANFVSDGQTIFLDSSEVSCCLAPLLQGFDDITVVTPNIRAVTLLSKYPSVLTVCVCGCLHNDNLSVSGSYALDFLENFNADLALVRGDGFDLNTGLTDISMSEAGIKKKMLSRAKQRVIVCPSDRIGRVAPFMVCDCKGFDTLITDDRLNPEKAEALMTERINFRCV